MYANARNTANSGRWDFLLCAVGIVAAAATPFIASRWLVPMSPGDEIGFALLAVGVVALVMDRRL